MTDTNLDCSQLELSKENIQPIRQGRKASALCNALDRDHQNKLQSERNEFEKEIRAYTGDDPLSVWHRYVLWVEQNYPKGGVQGNLTKLIESCFKTLYHNGDFDEKYKNDERFLNLWAKYATMSPSPMDIYQNLYAKNIFTQLARFYEIWAWELEQHGNVKKANSIYLDGCGRKAKPTELLDVAYGKFLARVAKMTLEGMNKEDCENNEFMQRQALAALKGKGSKAKAPTERISTVIGTAGKISSDCPKINNVGSSFKIFQDENSCQDQIMENVSENQKHQFTSVSALTKENMKNPSMWNKNKMKQRNIPTVLVEDVNYVNTPSFTVHSDDVEANPQSVTTKVTEFSNVLSARKCQKEWKVPLFIPEPFNPYAQPQYCKHRVYCGNEEFSFEELLALDRQKKEEESKKNSILEEQVRNLQLQLKNKEDVLRSLLQKQNTSGNACEEVKLTPKANIKPEQKKESEIHKKVCSNDSNCKKIYEDSFLVINKSVSFAANTTQNVYDESSTKALLDLQPVIPISLALPSQNHNASNSSSPSNNISTSKEVTVNTKFAKNVVLELFNATLSNNIATQEETLPILCKDDKSLANGNAVVASEPFQIYEDEKELDCPMPLSKNEQQNSFTSFPIYHYGNKQPMDVAHGFNEEKGCSAGFAIYSDEKPEIPTINVEIPTIHEPFPIYTDENESCPIKMKQIAKVTPFGSFKNVLQEKDKHIFVPEITKDSHPKYLNDDKENITPSDYQTCKEKRPISGILKPSLTVPFIPLEEQKEMENVKNYEDERLDGIEPLPECNEEYMTMKIPFNSESFAKDNFVASTPAPWSISLVPQVKQDDDFTMALPLRRNVLPEATENEVKNTDTYLEKSSENSSELMPPPPNVGTPSPNASQSSLESQSQRRPSQATKYLSPILEASRENRSSSTSSSSGSSTANYTSSNIYGLSGHASKSINVTQGKSFPGQEVNKDEENDDYNNSFDPDKIAAMLLGENPVLVHHKEVDSSKSAKISQCSIEKAEKESVLMGTGIEYPANIDPFCNDFRKLLLQDLKEPVASRGGFIPINVKMPLIKARSKISLGKEMYNVKRLIGSGAYAQIFHTSTIDPMNVTVAMLTTHENDEDYVDDDDGNEESQMVMKVQKPQCQWEFYICHELRERLKKIGAPEKILDSFMRINRGYFFSQGSILVSQYHSNGTIIDLINKYKKAGKVFPEEVIVLIMREVISTLIYLHSCSIIHGDLKPDNVLIVNIPDDVSADSDESLLPIIKLIDFGRSIDMKLLPENTTFSKKVVTSGFTCVEMKENRQWTYQTDLYGLAAIAHCLIWGTYMNVKKESDVWKVSGVYYQRYMDKDFWQDFFHKILNIPSCSDIPDLKAILQDFEEKIEHFDHFKDRLKICKGILKQ